MTILYISIILGGFMKSLTKRTRILAAVIIVSIFAVVESCLIFGSHAYADDSADNSYNYFYNQIQNDPIAVRFYKAFETLYISGEFKDGKLQYELISNGVATKAEVEAYVNGADENRLVKSFGAGRDAFYLDHPDLFYIDVFSVSVTAGMMNGEYVAYLDSSKVLSLYRGESINSESAVNAAIKEYEDAISVIVTEANKLSTVIEKIEYVNDYIGKNTTYGFGVKSENGRNVDTPKADYIYTSYGALVNKESVCEGYAKSFKAVMDRLGIPCVCVQGYADSDNGNKQPHMWNYVQVEGMWYAVDVTYNSTSSQNKWMLLGGQSMFDDHYEDGVVSSSDYELLYPALKPYDYGNDTDDNDMVITGSYEESENQGKILHATVSYKNKGARILYDEGLYLAYSYNVRDYDSGEMYQTNWVSIVDVNMALKYDLFPVTDTDTTLLAGTDIKYVQFAILNRAPDYKGDMLTGESLVAYNPENLKDKDFYVEPSVPYRNEGFGTYSAAPGAISITPSNTGTLKVDNTYSITIVYNEMLELDAGYTIDTIDMDIECTRSNDIVKNYAKIENFEWDGDKTVSFDFTPSKMYIHNDAAYYFTPLGLIGKISKKEPNPVSFYFSGKNVVCSKIFNDGRLYMSVYGEPNLLDNSDVSVTDFKDSNGNYFAESQRSQLLLVASKPTTAQEQEMEKLLQSEKGIKDGEIIASSTYEINLQICGVIQKVPNGSYMQVAFGFPEGYSPEDEGATFKIYHYKHDDKGNITGVEEIPVIINEYGIIAKVSSFSPFTIVQIKNDSAAVTQSKTANIYAYVNGAGGTITSAGKSGISQVSDKITYDITPDEGYEVACVRLNGEVIDSKYYVNGKLTLAKADIESSNMLEVNFMTREFLNSYAESGVSISFGNVSDYAPTPYKSNAAKIAIICIVVIVVVSGIAVGLVFFMKQRKQKLATATAGAKTNSGVTAVKTSSTKTATNKTTAVKSTAATRPAPTTTATRPTATRPAPTTTATRPTATRPAPTASATRTAATRPAPTASATRTAATRPAPTTTATRPTATRPAPTATAARPTTTRPAPTASTTRTAATRPAPTTNKTTTTNKPTAKK